MKAFTETVVNAGNGLPVEGAVCQWLDGSGVAVTTYSDATFAGAATSAVTDENGMVTRYIPDGNYTFTVTYTYAGTEYTSGYPIQHYDDAEQEDLTGRALVVPSGETGVTLPSIASRAGKYLGFDASGAATAVSGTLGSPNMTSVSSVTVGTGSKSFTASTGSLAQPGQSYVVADAAAPATNYMVGRLTAYNSTTGALTINVTTSAGSGTISNWVLSPEVTSGATALGSTGDQTLSGRLGIGTSPSYELQVAGSGYLSGTLGIGSATGATISVRVGRNITGGVSSYGNYADGIIQSDVTTSADYSRTVAQTAAAAFTLSSLRHYVAAQGTFGAGSAVTSQMGFMAESSLTGATNNYGFYSNIASGSNRWNFYAAGTAANYFGGTVTFNAGITEKAYAIVDGGAVDLNPANGSMQTWTLGANRTPTATSFAAGQSMLLHVCASVSAYTVTWPSVTWVGGSAPALPTTGYAVITLWKVASTLYGCGLGNVA